MHEFNIMALYRMVHLYSFCFVAGQQEGMDNLPQASLRSAPSPSFLAIPVSCIVRSHCPCVSTAIGTCHRRSSSDRLLHRWFSCMPRVWSWIYLTRSMSLASRGPAHGLPRYGEPLTQLTHGSSSFMILAISRSFRLILTDNSWSWALVCPQANRRRSKWSTNSITGHI